jgi:hypothetical protein
MRWETIIVGAVVAYALQLGWGMLLGEAGATPTAFILSGFVSLLLGGFVAGRLAARQELLHGTLSAPPFIVVAELLQSLGEIETSRSLSTLAMPRLNMGGLALSDLILLAGAAAGGWIAGLLAPGRKEA